MADVDDPVEDITKHITEAKKHIFILNGDGFGNKVFDLIRAVYLYNLYGGRCVVNYIPYMSKHEVAGDPTIGEIFLSIGDKINLMSHDEYNALVASNIKFDKFFGFKSLSELPEYSALGQYTKICRLFDLTFEMYKTFNAEDRKLFTINKSMIQDKHNILMRIPHMQYAAIHIRYGDKLKMCAESNQNTFLVNNPQYYIDMIHNLRKMRLNSKMPVYIVTDSNSVVEEFIINKHFKHDPHVELIKSHWLDTFYMISHATIIVMSCSTFCFAATYFNHKKPKCFLSIQPDQQHSPEERAISPDWNIVYDEKYILNNDKPLAIEMNKFNVVSEVKPDMLLTTPDSIAPYIQTVKDLPKKKQIYLRDRHDLGGRIFSLIQAVYLQKLYGKSCDVNYVEYQSEMYIERPPPIDEIFNKTRDVVNFITPAEYEKLLPLLSEHAHTEECYTDLSNIPKAADLGQLNRFCRKYKLTSEMVDTFTESDLKLFNINPKLISPNVLKMQHKKYAVVYVYYGLLLEYANKDNVDFDLFLIYTPQYYIDMIKYLLRKDGHMEILIVTNTPDIVKKYILPSTTAKNVKMLDASIIDSFYLMTYASYIIMSDRPLCFVGSLFNHRTGFQSVECYMATYRDPDSHHINEQVLSDSFYKKLFVSHERRYILNYNKPLVKELLELCLKDPKSKCYEN